MKTISIQIDNIINKELSLINNKINGLLLLEILKYKIIDNLKEINFSSINYQDDLVDSNYEDDIRKINVKIINENSPIINLISELENNILLICLKELIKIDLIDQETNKNMNIKCIPLTGVVIPKGSKCSLNYNKNSVFIKISLQDKLENIEKYKENTI